MESVTFGKVFFLMLAVSIDSFAKQSSPHKYIVKRLIGSEVILNCSKIPQLPGNWKQNGETLYINRIPTKAIYRKTLILQDDYSLKIPFLKVNNEGNYTCVIDSRLAETYILGVEVKPLLKIIVNDDENITRAFLEHGAETSVKCMAVRSRPQVNLTYEIAHEDALKVNHNISSNRRDGHTYDTVLEVIFVPRRLNGTIKCVSSDQYSFPAQSIRVQYESYVVPTTHLLINNQESYNVVHVEMLATLSAVCSSFGARPVDELSWLINDVPANQLIANSTIRSLSSPTNEYTYDSVSFLAFRPKDKNGSVVCLSKSGAAGRERSVKAHYVTYVIPTVELTINGMKNDQPILINDFVNMLIVCRVSKSRPAVTIKWLLDNEELLPLRIDMNSTNKHKDDTFDSVSSLVGLLQFKRRSGNITCICEGLPTGKLHSNIYFGVTEERIKIKYSLVLFVGLVIVLTTALSALIWCIIKRHAGFPEEITVRNQLSLTERSATLISCKACDPPTTDQPGSSLVEKADDTFQKTVCPYNPPSIRLPNIPDNSPASVSSGVPEKENGHYYATIKDHLSHDRLFQMKDVCFILEMKVGNVYTRWMGTVSSSKRKRCVVLTTIKEELYEKGEFQWDLYVKRLLDLPTSKNIPSIEGICIDGANMFLVNEHVTCETLETVIDPKQHQRESIFIDPIISHDSMLRSYVMDVLEGVEFIQSYGFLHPGLTMKKVLVSGTRICKLYDFCLAEDATHRVKTIKNKESDISMEILAPESLQRSEYTQASDVWSVALVICKIISKDGLDGNCEIGGDNFKSNLTSVLPAKFLKLEKLMECFAYDSEQRPTISTLRCLLRQEMDDNRTYETSMDVLSDTYVPMESITGGRTL